MNNEIKPPVYIFTCGAAEERSPRAVRFAKEIARARELNIEFYCAKSLEVFNHIIKGTPMQMFNENREKSRIYSEGGQLDALFPVTKNIEFMFSEAIKINAIESNEKNIPPRYNGPVICLNISEDKWTEEELRNSVSEGIMKCLKMSK